MKITNYILLVVIIGIFSILIQHYVIYRFFIMPHLSEWNAVPVYWWCVYMLPIICALTAIGTKAKNIIQVFLAGLSLAVASNILVVYWSFRQEPSFHKAYEGPISVEFITGIAMHLPGVLVLLLIGYIYSRIIIKLR